MKSHVYLYTSLPFLILYYLRVSQPFSFSHPKDNLASRPLVQASEPVPALSPTSSCGLISVPYCPAETPLAFMTLHEYLFKVTRLKVWSALSLSYLRNTSYVPMCHVSIFRKKQAVLNAAIHRNCAFTLYVDDIPLFARVGQLDTQANKTFVFTHFALSLAHDTDGRIVHAELNQSGLTRSNSGDLNFTFSASWIPAASEDIKNPGSRAWKAIIPADSSGVISTNNVLWTFNGALLFGVLIHALASALKEDPVSLTPSLDDDHTHVNNYRPPATVILAGIVGVGAQLSIFTMCLAAHAVYVGSMPSNINTLKLYSALGPLAGIIAATAFRALNGTGLVANALSALVSALIFPMVSICFVLAAHAVFPSPAPDLAELVRAFSETTVLGAMPLCLLGYAAECARIKSLNVERNRGDPGKAHLKYFTGDGSRPGKEKFELWRSAFIHGLIPFFSISLHTRLVLASLCMHSLSIGSLTSLFLVIIFFLLISAICGALVASQAHGASYYWPCFMVGYCGVCYSTIFAAIFFARMQKWEGSDLVTVYVTKALITASAAALAAGAASYSGGAYFRYQIKISWRKTA